MGHSLTKLEMAEKLQQDLGFSRKEAKDLVDSFFEEIITALEEGNPVKISGFGNFDLRAEAANGVPVNPGFVVFALIYGTAYTIVLLLLATLAFERKDV